MNIDKTLICVTVVGVVAAISSFAYYSSHAPARDPREPDPEMASVRASLKAFCEKEHNCTYQVEGPQPGTTSTVYEIDGLRFSVPDALFPGDPFSPQSAKYGTRISVWLPDLTPLSYEERRSHLENSPKYIRQLDISFEKNSRQPHAVQIQELENKIIALRQAPKPVPGIPSLQEYASPGKKSYFRGRDIRIRYYDGLPVYFVCHGDSVILGYDPIANVQKAVCNMGMTWPNGFEVNISFNESRLPEWNTILGTATGFLKSLEDQHRLPVGTLALD